MSPPPHEIIVVPAVDEPEHDALWQQCYAVRVDVFHREQGFPLDTEIDELDRTATHLLLRLVPSRTPIGTIRWSQVRSGHYKLSRLAVLSDYRQFRFGRALVLALHDCVTRDARTSRGLGPVSVEAHSQIPAKGFYAKFGYEPEGDEFAEDGAPHQNMVVRLST